MPQGVGSGKNSMPTQQQAPHRTLDTPDDLAEARLEAIGYVFHGQLGLPNGNGKRPAVKAGTNLLHFARCMKLDKVGDGESMIWFRTISIAKTHLDETYGTERWKWCKVCEREITQKILNER
jgi:hypothetical protein